MEEKKQQMFENLREKSFEELHLLFRNGPLPKFEEFKGETIGQFLALNPKISYLVEFFMKVLFESPIGRWTGKKIYYSL